GNRRMPCRPRLARACRQTLPRAATRAVDRSTTFRRGGSSYLLTLPASRILPTAPARSGQEADRICGPMRYTRRMPKRPRAKPTRRAPNYDRKLTRRFVLQDGTRIVTLRDAANLFAKRFANVKSWRLLERAIE